jgi:hypothetical protein
MKKRARLTRYTNAVTIKYDNRRTTIIDEGDYVYQFNRMKDPDDDRIPSARIIHIRDKVIQTEIRISKEGSEMLLAALASMFNVKIVKA